MKKFKNEYLYFIAALITLIASLTSNHQRVFWFIMACFWFILGMAGTTNKRK